MDPTGNTVALRIIIIVILLALSAYFSSAETALTMVNKIRMECLPGAGNAGKSEHAALIVTTFVHDRAGFQKDGTADNELGNGWGCYDLGLQNENLVLKAVDLGLSTLIMGLREADRLHEILNIPESETIVAVIAVGKAAEEPIHPQRKPIEEIAKFF